MRTSNIILATLFMFFLGVAVVVVITLRYKQVHHLYSSKTEQYHGTPTGLRLQAVSRILVEKYGSVTIRQGDADSISFSDSAHALSAIRQSQDTLVIMGGDFESPDNTTITVRNLSEVRLKEVSRCDLFGFGKDSLAVYADQGDIAFDSSALQNLHLELGGESTFTLSNSQVKDLWLGMKDKASLSLENARIGSIGGYWKGQINLDEDSATLKNGIGKIELTQ